MSKPNHQVFYVGELPAPTKSRPRRVVAVEYIAERRDGAVTVRRTKSQGSKLAARLIALAEKTVEGAEALRGFDVHAQKVGQTLV